VCGCGRPGTVLAGSGSGLIGWRHLTPSCPACAGDRPALTVAEFAARLDGPVRAARPLSATLPPVAQAAETAAVPPAAVPPATGLPITGLPATGGESPVAVLTAEIALLHARLDDQQSRLDR